MVQYYIATRMRILLLHAIIGMILKDIIFFSRTSCCMKEDRYFYEEKSAYAL